MSFWEIAGAVALGSIFANVFVNLGLLGVVFLRRKFHSKTRMRKFDELIANLREQAVDAMEES